MKAYTVKAEGYATVISIASDYTEKSKKILCAHELGHALLHEDGYNTFDVSVWKQYTALEYEANIFALALLTEEKALPKIKELSPYEVKKHLDKKILKEELQ